MSNHTRSIVRISGLLSIVLLAACSSQPLVTAQEGQLERTTSFPELPADSGRYFIADPLPSGSVVETSAPRRQLVVLDAANTRTIDTLRFFTDANGLPLIEMPIEPVAASDQLRVAIDALGWRVRQVELDESRISIDGSPWLQRRTDQLFPARPQINIYFYSFSNGTQVHMEREGDMPFPVATQRELLQELFAQLQ
ncbi:hypothetical protein NFC81_11195 [Salinispirillum sp. LH 10-3-1]|uniref:Lipoprotein n=1 Tax=Salinispirillum sp. LH 10-3-1 TaxID=2952525 RepID=A0AB38YE02_9GAMM